MKVNLYNIQEVEYEIKENKCSKIPFDVFCKMGNIDLRKSSGNTYPSARFFSNIDEFKEIAEKNHTQFDKDSYVYVMSNGKICVLLADVPETSSDIALEKNVDTEENKVDGTTNTEEDKGKES